MDIKPIRIQRSRQHKQVSPNGLPIMYVGRPTKWGNPFKVMPAITLADTPEKIVNAYQVYLQACIATGKLDVSELKGKNLSCWCKPGQHCHADVLLKIANQ